MALGGTASQGIPNKAGGLEIKDQMWLEGTSFRVGKQTYQRVFVFPRNHVKYCLESRRHFPTEARGGGQVRRQGGLISELIYEFSKYRSASLRGSARDGSRGTLVDVQWPGWSSHSGEHQRSRGCSTDESLHF